MIMTYNNTSSNISSTYKMTIDSMNDTVYTAYYMHNNVHYKIKLLAKLT